MLRNRDKICRQFWQTVVDRLELFRINGRSCQLILTTYTKTELQALVDRRADGELRGVHCTRDNRQSLSGNRCAACQGPSRAAAVAKEVKERNGFLL